MVRARLPWLRSVVFLVIGALPGACSGAVANTPLASPTANPVPTDVAATIQWMVERTMSCSEEVSQGAARQWRCTGAAPWTPEASNKLTVLIVREAGGATHVVATLDATETMGLDLCGELTCDGYTGFFSDTIALAPVLGAEGPAVGQWVDTNPHVSWRRQFGSATVEFRPVLPSMSMTIDIPPGG